MRMPHQDLESEIGKMSRSERRRGLRQLRPTLLKKLKQRVQKITDARLLAESGKDKKS